MLLILYSKPGCHLCEGLQEKLEDIQNNPRSVCQFDLEIRDITTNNQWFEIYQYEIPVLFLVKSQPEGGLSQEVQPLPRPSPRASVSQLEQMLSKYLLPGK